MRSFSLDVKSVDISAVDYNFISLNFECDEDDLFNALDLTDDEVLERVDKIYTSEAVDHFGKDNLLDEIGIEYIKSYFNLKEEE